MDLSYILIQNECLKISHTFVINYVAENKLCWCPMTQFNIDLIIIDREQLKQGNKISSIS